MRTIDADVLKDAFEMDGYLSPYMRKMIDACPTLEVVPMNYHEQCMQLSVNRRIQAEKAVPKWISVKDRLPEPDTKVLVYGRNEYGVYCITCHYSAHRKWLYHNRTTAEGKTITHWMPLPEPPKEE